MGYYVDLKSISIDQYKNILKAADLLPSWKILGNNIEENLDAVKKLNIRNLYELLKVSFKCFLSKAVCQKSIWLYLIG